MTMDWHFLGKVGSLIIKKQPNFYAINFGFGKLTPLFKSYLNLKWKDRANTIIDLNKNIIINF